MFPGLPGIFLPQVRRKLARSRGMQNIGVNPGKAPALLARLNRGPEQTHRMSGIHVLTTAQSGSGNGLHAGTWRGAVSLFHEALF